MLGLSMQFVVVFVGKLPDQPTSVNLKGKKRTFYCSGWVGHQSIHKHTCLHDGVVILHRLCTTLVSVCSQIIILLTSRLVTWRAELHRLFFVATVNSGSSKTYGHYTRCNTPHSHLNYMNTRSSNKRKTHLSLSPEFITSLITHAKVVHNVAYNQT